MSSMSSPDPYSLPTMLATSYFPGLDVRASPEAGRRTTGPRLKLEFGSETARDRFAVSCSIERNPSLYGVASNNVIGRIYCRSKMIDGTDFDKPTKFWQFLRGETSSRKILGTNRA